MYYEMDRRELLINFDLNACASYEVKAKLKVVGKFFEAVSERNF